jgi:hypothetical protein
MARLLDQFTSDLSAIIADTEGVAESITIVDGTTTAVRGFWREQDPTEAEDRSRNRIRRAEAWIAVANYATPTRTATFALTRDTATTWVVDEIQRDTAGGLWHLILHRSERIETAPRTYRRGE